MPGDLLPRHEGHQEKAQNHFKRNNDIVKYGYWIVVALVLFSWLVVRSLRFFARKRQAQGYIEVDAGHGENPKSRGSDSMSGSPPGRMVGPAFRTPKAALQGMFHRRVAFSGRWLQYLNPPSLGQSLFLCLYWAIILAGLWTNVIFKSPSDLYGIKWEVVGFRAAWVSTTQLPLLYATGCRFNIISLITGITHERLNWFHRWIARTVFMTLIVHWAFFYREWDIAGVVQKEIEMMPMIIWGFAAWGAIGLMVVTGFGWFRDRFFEAWLVSHILLAWAVLALSYTHTHCTTYFVGASIGMLGVDLTTRVLLTLFHNLDYRALGSGSVRQIGHHAMLERLNEEYLRLMFDARGIQWKAGQHVHITVPKIRLFQSHPFTIVGASADTEDSPLRQMTLVIKAHSGFTKELHNIVSETPTSRVRVLVHGPCGNPPTVENKDVVILIATGNRASFAVSMLGAIARQAGRKPDVIFHWIIPEIQMAGWYERELQDCISEYATSDAQLDIQLHVTRAKKLQTPNAPLLSDDIREEVFSIGRHSEDSEDGSPLSVEKDAIEMTETQSHPKTGESFVDDGKRVLLPAQDTQSYDNSSTVLRPLVSKLKDQFHAPISFCRPSAKALLEPAIEDSNPRQNVMVIAAVPAGLAADISRTVSCLVGTEMQRKNLELWIEESGS